MRRITSYTNIVETRHGVSLPQPEQITRFDYGYNKEGMRTYENYTPGIGETNQSPKAKVFSYDSLYQITGVKYDVPNPLAELQTPGSQTYSKQVTYDFDNAGNRNTVETRHGVSLPETTNYQANSLNQYTQIDSGVFGYDSVGNMTTGVIYLDDQQNPGQKTPVQARFIYDYQNNLVRAEQVSDNRILGEYIYDVLGRRAYKNAWDRETAAYQTTWFWYNGSECIEETDSTGTTIATYVFGIGIDEAINIEYPVASEQYSQSGTYWYHTNVLGSVVAITDSDGVIVERNRYDIYGEATVLAPDGETIRAESMIGNRILYTGREYDKETGLYYYRARYYHAQIGRFISADPTGADGLGNLFAYSMNSPLNYTDPYGTDPLDDEVANDVHRQLQTYKDELSVLYSQMNELEYLNWLAKGAPVTSVVFERSDGTKFVAQEIVNDIDNCGLNQWSWSYSLIQRNQIDPDQQLRKSVESDIAKLKKDISLHEELVSEFQDYYKYALLISSGNSPGWYAFLSWWPGVEAAAEAIVGYNLSTDTNLSAGQRVFNVGVSAVEVVSFVTLIKGVAVGAKAVSSLAKAGAITGARAVKNAAENVLLKYRTNKGVELVETAIKQNVINVNVSNKTIAERIAKEFIGKGKITPISERSTGKVAGYLNETTGRLYRLPEIHANGGWHVNVEQLTPRVGGGWTSGANIHINFP